MKDTVKKASSDEDRIKYLKYALAAGIAAAGIGAVAREIKVRKMREKALNASENKSAIVVPIKKTKFMEGLPTPRELAKERGETGSSAAAPMPSGDGADSQKDLASLKKDILRRGRKLNFFGKRAEDGGEGKPNEDKGGNGGNDGKGESNKKEPARKQDVGDGKEPDGRLVLRDRSGKFVSPTDPLAVAQVEKVAGLEWVWDTLAHPVDSAGKVWNAAKEKPVLYTAGALGSIYIAAKLTEYINNIRKERSKERLEDAREKYVGLLQETPEKKASAGVSDPRTTAGTVLGTAFLVPLALTALVTNRIIENRKEEKRRQKDMSDSFPEEPIILYKTSEDRSIATTPEAILSVIMVKRAMLMSDEMRESGMSKGAQDAAGATQPQPPVQTPTRAWGRFASTAKDLINKGKVAIDTAKAKPFSEQEAADWAVGKLADPSNRKHLLNMARAYSSNDDRAGEKAFEDMLKQYDDGDSYRFRNTMTMVNGAKDKVKGLINTSPKLENALVEGYTNDPEFQKHTEEMIGKNLSGTFRPGSLIHSLMSWIANTFGIGKGKAVQAVRDRFAGARQQMENSRMAGYGASNSGNA